MKVGDYIGCARCGHHAKITDPMLANWKRRGVRSVARSKALFECSKCGGRDAVLVPRAAYEAMRKDVAREATARGRR